MRARFLIVAMMCLIATACRPSKPVSVRIDPALAALVPPEASVLVGVRLESIKDSYLWRRYVEGQSMPGLDRFIKLSGLDPRQDIYETLFVSDGKVSLVMARGKFSSEGGMEPRLNFPDAKRISYKSYTLVGGDDGALVFMNPSVVVAGPVAALKWLIDHRDKGLGIPPALAQAVDQIPQSNQIWVISNRSLADLSGGAPQGQAQPSASPQFATLLQFAASVRSLRAMADLRTGLNLQVIGNCGTDNDARHLNDALRGLMGFARLQTEDNQRELLRAYDAVKVSSSGPTVTIAADLAQDQLERLVGELDKLKPKQPKLPKP